MYSLLLPRRPCSVVYDLGLHSLLRPVFPILFIYLFVHKIGKYEALANELVQCHFSLSEALLRSKTYKKKKKKKKKKMKMAVWELMIKY